jgi:predicted O-methyltransferase YrrM
MAVNEFEFTNSWFASIPRPIWDQIIPQHNPTKILEIGSYEGASAVYLLEKLGNELPLEVCCVDTWSGGVEHDEVNMSAVEARFDKNISLAKSLALQPVSVKKYKSQSDVALAELLTQGYRNHFDFIYVDGSHQAPDVLCDAVLAFRLLRVGGIMAFDDYLWSEALPGGMDPIRCPKPAIDAFTNLYCRKILILQAPLYQLYVQKIAD